MCLAFARPLGEFQQRKPWVKEKTKLFYPDFEQFGKKEVAEFVHYDQ